MPGIRRLLIAFGGVLALTTSSGLADDKGASGTTAQADAAKRGEAVFDVARVRLLSREWRQIGGQRPKIDGDFP